MSKERILILDEEANAQWALSEFLESKGFSAAVVNSIKQALEIIKIDNFSALITEYRVEQATTLGVVREFKAAFPEAYVLMLSYGEVGEGEYEEIISTGTDDFFYKPIDFKKLGLHLEKGLDHRRKLLLKNELEEELKRLNVKTSTREEPPGSTVQQNPHSHPL
jgi:DNA-binding NtrC family response regulator